MTSATRLLMMAGMATFSLAATRAPAAAQVKNVHRTTGQPTILTVYNTRDVPVMVYLDRGQIETRLGSVGAHTETPLQLPSSMEDGEEIDVLVHPKGDIDLATGELPVTRGENLGIYVPTNDVGYIPPPPPRTIPNPGKETTTVTVQNNRAVPVTVYIDHGEFDTRIGEIPANQQSTLGIPEWVVRRQTTAQFILTPRGQVELASPFLDLGKGSHLFVEVPVFGK